jgi:hypothetical protein
VGFVKKKNDPMKSIQEQPEGNSNLAKSIQKPSEELE